MIYPPGLAPFQRADHPSQWSLSRPPINYRRETGANQTIDITSYNPNLNSFGFRKSINSYLNHRPTRDVSKRLVDTHSATGATRQYNLSLIHI